MRRWRSTLDRSTCPACRVLDGRRIGEAFSPPHGGCANTTHGCRCVVETDVTQENRGWLAFYSGVFVATVTRDVVDGRWWWVALDVVLWTLAVAFTLLVNRRETQSKYAEPAHGSSAVN